MMGEKIFQIVYCSRNNISGTPMEVRIQLDSILDASRRNNARSHLTGALLYNTLYFVQVLEGNLVEVERTFERVQLDRRHSDLVVLQSGFVPGRDFADWSMAYTGASADFGLPFENASQTLETPANGMKIKGFMREVVRARESWAFPELRLVHRMG